MSSLFQSTSGQLPVTAYHHKVLSTFFHSQLVKNCERNKTENQSNWRDIMLYSEVLKGGEMESAEIPIETAQGISLAFEYAINVIPAAAIKPDGNCVIELGMDQMKRYVYYINDFTQKFWTLFPP